MADGAAPDPVTSKRVQNPANVDLGPFYFVAHPNFDLREKPSEYRKPVPRAPGPLPREKHWPMVPADLVKLVAKTKGTTPAPGALSAWAARHRVKGRWLYCISVDDTKTRAFQYEIRTDANGNVAYLAASAFRALHADPAVDDQSDQDYLKHAQWTKTHKPYFRPTLPLARHNQPVRWHFFSSRVRLRAAAVDELERDPHVLGPDPGYDRFAKDAAGATVEEAERLLERGGSVSVDKGVLVRVFDPLLVVDNMRKELARDLDQWIVHQVPHPSDPDRAIRQARVELTIAAHFAKVVAENVGSTTNVDVVRDEILTGAQAWGRLRGAFTPKEREIVVDASDDPTKWPAHEYFLRAEKHVRDHHVDRVEKCARKLVLWLSSRAWKFIEDVYGGHIETANARLHELLEPWADGLARLCETDIGRNFVTDLIEHYERDPADDSVAGIVTLKDFVLRDKAPRPGLDTAKIAIKAGKAPFDLWARSTSLISAFDRVRLTKLFDRHRVDLEPKMLDELLTLPQGVREELASRYLQVARLRRVYTVEIVKLTLTVETSAAPSAYAFASDKSVRVVVRQHTLRATVTVDTSKALEALQKKVTGAAADAKRGLTRSHVSGTFSVLGAFFAMRDLYTAAKEKGALDRTRAAFGAISAIYGLPPVGKALQARLARGSTKAIGEAAAELAAKRTIAMIGFFAQCVTLAFSVYDVWKSHEEGTAEDFVSSSTNLVAGSLALIAGGLMVASGGTLTPASAILLGLSAVFSVGQFIYDFFKPTEPELLLRYCVFGKGYIEKLGAPEKRAKPWMACPDDDLRHFHPEFARGGYRTQLAAFVNLIHNYGVHLEFSTRKNDPGCFVVLHPGAVPRNAFFDVQIELAWFRLVPYDITKLPPITYGFRFYPDAHGVPAELRRVGVARLGALAERGITEVSGGPLDVVVARGGSTIRLDVQPTSGDVTRWTGVLKSKNSGKQAGGSLPIEVEVPMRLTTEVSGERGKTKLLGTIDHFAEMPEHLKVAKLRVGVRFRRMFIDTTRSAEEQYIDDTYEPKVTATKNKAGRERIEFEIDVKEPDHLYYYEFETIWVEVIYKDTSVPKTTFLRTGRIPAAVPASKVNAPKASGKTPPVHVEVEFEAALTHPGDHAHVHFRGTKVTATLVDDPKKSWKVHGATLRSLRFEYACNEGAGAPAQRGSRAVPLALPLVQNPDGGFVGTARGEALAIAVGDRVTGRFTGILTAGSARTASEFEPDLVASWSLEDPDDEDRYDVKRIIREASARVRLSLEEDARGGKFVPSTVGLAAGHPTYVRAVCIPGALTDRLEGDDPNVDTTGNRRWAADPPRGDIVMATSACKSK